MTKILYGLALKDSDKLFGYDGGVEDEWITPSNATVPFLCETAQVADHVRRNVDGRKRKKYPYVPEHNFDPEQIEVVQVHLSWKLSEKVDQ